MSKKYFLYQINAYICLVTKQNNMKLYNIQYKNGSNEIELFSSIKDFGKWWSKMVKLGNRRKNSVLSVIAIN